MCIIKVHRPFTHLVRHDVRRKLSNNYGVYCGHGLCFEGMDFEIYDAVTGPKAFGGARQREVE